MRPSHALSTGQKEPGSLTLQGRQLPKCPSSVLFLNLIYPRLPAREYKHRLRCSKGGVIKDPSRFLTALHKTQNLRSSQERPQSKFFREARLFHRLNRSRARGHLVGGPAARKWRSGPQPEPRAAGTPSPADPLPRPKATAPGAEVEGTGVGCGGGDTGGGRGTGRGVGGGEPEPPRPSTFSRALPLSYCS